MSGCYAQVLEVNTAERVLIIFDGETTVEAILTESAAEELNRNENGIGVGKLHGRTLALMDTVLLPILNVVPPSVTLILQKVRVFSDRLAQRPFRTPPTVVSNPNVSRALRTAHLNLLMKKIPQTPTLDEPIIELATSRQSWGPPPTAHADAVSIPTPIVSPPQGSKPRLRISGSFSTVAVKGTILSNKKESSKKQKEVQKSNEQNSTESSPCKKSQETNNSPKPNAKCRANPPVAEEGTSTEEIDSEQHKQSFPEIRQSLIEQGSLRAQSPPPLGEEEENGNSDHDNCSSDNDEESQKTVAERARKRVPNTLEVVDLPMTQFYDDDDDDDDDEEEEEKMEVEKELDNESEKAVDGKAGTLNVESKVPHSLPHQNSKPKEGNGKTGEVKVGIDEANIVEEIEVENVIEEEEEEPLPTLSPDPNVNPAGAAGVTTSKGNVDNDTNCEMKKPSAERLEVDIPASQNEVEEEDMEIDPQVEKGDVANKPTVVESVQESAETQAPNSSEVEKQGTETDKLLINNQALLAQVADRVDSSMKLLNKFFEEASESDYWNITSASL